MPPKAHSNGSKRGPEILFFLSSKMLPDLDLCRGSLGDILEIMFHMIEL